eukprot:78355_1
MNPPKPSNQAINESITTVDLSVNPNKWLPMRFKQIEKHIKTHSQNLPTHNNKYTQQKLDQNIKKLRISIEDQFEKLLGYKPKYIPMANNTEISFDNNSELPNIDIANNVIAANTTCKNNIEWVRYYDEKHKLHYFYDINTNEIHWKLPLPNTKYIDYGRNIHMKGFDISCIYDNNTMQYVFKNEKTGNVISKKQAYNNLWIKHFDRNNNNFYYENTATHHIQDTEPSYPYLWAKSSGNSRDISHR